MSDERSRPKKKSQAEEFTIRPVPRPVPATFGPYLAELRAERGLSLREAADAIGISFGYLRKLESAERVPRPSILLLQQIAAAYDQPSADVFIAAGLRRLAIEDHSATVNRMFHRLVMHPRLMPRGMDARNWLDSFSTRQKSQWIEFAQRLQSYILDEEEQDDRGVLQILRGMPPSYEDEEDPE